MSCADIPSTTVDSIPAFLDAVSTELAEWKPVFPWFRGESLAFSRPLTPLVYRVPRREYRDDTSELIGHHYNENNLLQSFRRRAHLMGLPIVPLRQETDKWLFLARHVGLPTRLLDWSGNALVGLYFALHEPKPVVWALNPHELNLKSAPDSRPNTFPLTWFPGEGERNIGYRNVAAAWRLGERALGFPVAVEPTNIHPRMNAQHSFFTVHGTSPEPLCEQVGPSCLRKFLIQIADKDELMRELRRLGVAHSTVLPDAEGLATELRRLLIVPD